MESVETAADRSLVQWGGSDSREWKQKKAAGWKLEVKSTRVESASTRLEPETTRMRKGSMGL